MDALFVSLASTVNAGKIRKAGPDFTTLLILGLLVMLELLERRTPSIRNRYPQYGYTTLMK